MKAWLITHNPDNWQWPDFDKAISDTQSGSKVVISWSCSNTHVEVGDRVFCTRTGTHGNGIFASGIAKTKSYQEQSYDSTKGKTPHIDVEFDWIFDPIKTTISLQELNNDISGQKWAPQNSGIEINETAYKKLEFKWAKLVGVERDAFHLLQAMDDIDPDSHDGSYELMRSTVAAYAALPNIDSVTFADLDLVYLSAVIFNDIKRNQDLINASSLPAEAKESLLQTLSTVWSKAQANRYENIAKKPMSVGMFGTGFYTFDKTTTDPDLPKVIIGELIKISGMNDDDAIYSTVKSDLGRNLKGIGVPSFSIMAHCLKPNTFPIMNGNEGFGNIFELIGINIAKNKNLGNYADNCKAIKAFKESNFSFKNNRVFDIVARMIVKIDFLFTMNYIEKYGNKPYKKEEKCTTQAEIDEIKDIKKNAKKAVDETNKMASVIESEFGLNSWKPSAWTDGSHTKVRDYLWIKMQYENYKNTIDSISIFVNKSMPGIPGRDKPRIRFSLEMIDESADQAAYDNHHKFLDLPLTAGLCYVIGSDQLHDTVVLNETNDVIKSKVADGTYRKVQISKVIEYDPSLGNEEIFKEMMQGVSDLIPYYDYVIGKTGATSNPGSGTSNPTSSKGVKTMNDKIGLNTILYGPPGTGKTYNTKRYVVAICDGKTLAEVNGMDYETEVTPRYDELVKEGRVKFTTFHQSYGYEEFIEGIKPIVDEENNVFYDTLPGVFKKFCDDAKNSTTHVDSIGVDPNSPIWKMSLYGGKTDILKECFDEDYIRIGFDIDSSDLSMNIFKNKMQIGDIVLSLKSFYEINGIAIIDGDVEVLKDKTEFKVARKVKWLFKDKVINVREINGGNRLPLPTCRAMSKISRTGVMDLIKDNTDISIDEEAKPYVFVIDEINRGNISKIFGELITLIEESKRGGNKEAMSATLPYSGVQFSVPNNVYILGTMNTADRSISLMDTALRRRFDFVEMMPDANVVASVNVCGVDIKAMLEAMNKRIEVLYDREHTIGHAFFTGLTTASTVDDLACIFKNKVIPLLQEYFYEDYSKIRLVLGDNAKPDANQFVKEVKNNPSIIFKGSVTEEVADVRYEINESAYFDIDSYKEIY